METKTLIEKILTEYGISNPMQMKLDNILYGEGFVYNEEKLSTHQGRMTRDMESGIGKITVNSDIRETGKKNFVIAHELGHHFLSVGTQKFCRESDISIFKSGSEDERKANEFAAELLMPTEWVNKNIHWNGNAINLINQMAKTFNVSFTAAAIRYSTIGDKPIAVIASKENRVIWVNANKKMRYKYVKIGSEVHPESSASYIFNNGKTCSEIRCIEPEIWFSDDKSYKQNRANFYFYDGENYDSEYNEEVPYDVTYEEILKAGFHEQTFYMKNYGECLTMVWEGE